MDLSPAASVGAPAQRIVSKPTTVPHAASSSVPVEDSAQTGKVERELQLEEAREIQKLAQRDREVRSHEQAHAAAGGQYAGSIVLEYTRGPNGVSYASSGHVSIDSSKVPGDAETTLKKALVVQRAALAPAEPSSQDRQVAAKAAQMAVQARAEIARTQVEKSRPADPQARSQPEVESADFDSSNVSQ